MIRLQNKKSFRKNRVMIDIREFNKISEFDAYFMSLQSNIIFSIQKCKFISIINCVVFFHQWRVTMKNRHKLIVMSHRDSEQWNVTMMSWRNSPAYVQREMNDIFRKYSYVKIYIDDVVIFSNSFEKYLQYFNTIFALFETWNIILKITKTYFGYFSIFLLGQKMDSFELITTTDKLKAIIELIFSKILKNLETYLEMINYFRDYVFYYAQKSEFLQRRKTALLRDKSIKKIARKKFSKRTILDESSQKKLIFYKILREDFSQQNWLTHFSIIRVLFADINVSKYEFDVMIYHVKKN